MANEASAGTDSGKISRVKMVKGEAPSMKADSSISRGKLADVVVEQVGRQGQAEAGMGQPERQVGAVDAQRA